MLQNISINIIMLILLIMEQFVCKGCNFKHTAKGNYCVFSQSREICRGYDGFVTAHEIDPMLVENNEPIYTSEG